jgi:hypothetical protein
MKQTQHVKKAKANPSSSKKPIQKNSKPSQQKITLTSNKANNDMFQLGDFDDESDQETTSPDSPNALVSLSLSDDSSYRQMKAELAYMNRLHEKDQKEIKIELKKQKRMQNTDAQIDNDDDNHYQDEEDDGEELPLPPPPNPDCFNPFLAAYYVWLKNTPKDMDRLFDPSLSDNTRRVLIDHLPTKASRQYAWAIPTTEAIQVMHHFSPVIEIGAGKGYWGSLLRKYAHQVKLKGGKCKATNPDAVYVGFDCQPAQQKGEEVSLLNLEYKKQCQEDKLSGFLPAKKSKQDEPMRYIKDLDHPSWTHINVGDSNELKREKYSEHTLFLCYPDDFIFSERSLAFDCLRKFSGQYIITVGELLGETRQENPWGRSADGEFQQHLCDQFHKIAQIPLPSFHSSCDHLCVWKRTIKCVIDKTEDDDGMVFRYVPTAEKLSIRAFAPCLQDLNISLEENIIDNDDIDIMKGGFMNKSVGSDCDQEGDVPDLIDVVEKQNRKNFETGMEILGEKKSNQIVSKKEQVGPQRDKTEQKKILLKKSTPQSQTAKAGVKSSSIQGSKLELMKKVANKQGLVKK